MWSHRMRPPFFRDSRLLIVAGKGGVGKTTVAAVTAAAAAASGLRTLLVGLESPASLAALFGAEPFSESRVVVADRLEAQMVLADRALADWLSDKRLGRVADRLRASGALDMIATAVPGIRDILVLGRIKALVNQGDHDLVVVDGPASGHAITMLHTAAGLRESVSVGAIRQQADEVAATLADPAITQVVLVTLPEQTPVSETVETAFALEDRVHVRLGPLIVNRVESRLAGTLKQSVLSDPLKRLIHDRATRESSQTELIQRLRAQLPLPLVELPAVWDPSAVQRRTRLQEALQEALQQIVQQITAEEIG